MVSAARGWRKEDLGDDSKKMIQEFQSLPSLATWVVVGRENRSLVDAACCMLLDE
jgi:hypothetical protein